VRFGVGNFIDLGELAVSADEHGNPFRPLLILAHGRAISQGDGSIAIAQKITAKAKLFTPGL
jgi:hypothetical protein